MENNLEDHRAFRALYIGQRVLQSPISKAVYVLGGKTLADYYFKDGSCLSLKSLSAITDEDAIDYLIKIGVEPRHNLIQSAIHELVNNYCDDLFMCDYLRSKSFLIEFRNYKIDEILSMKWAAIEK